MDQLLNVVVAALVGAGASLIVAATKNRLEQSTAIDDHLRQKRQTVYQSIWSLTCALPRRPRLREITHAELTQLAIDMQQWYYGEGGLYLSTGGRKAYSAAMDVLESVRTSRTPEEEVDPAGYERCRQACSELRSWLTRDLLSRRAAPNTFGTAAH